MRKNKSRKRRKKRLKKSIKLTIFILIILMIIGVYEGISYYLSLSEADPHGTIEDAIPAEDEEKDDYELSTTPKADYWILNVGDGEAIFLRIGSTEALIDTGSSEYADKMVKTVKSHITGELDYVIITNGDKGRTGGIEKLYKSVKVKNTILGPVGDSKKSAEIKKLIGDNGTIINGKPTILDLEEGATLSIFKPEVSSDDIRDRSLMTSFTYGDTKFVSESDAGVEEEAKLIGLVQNCDVVVLSRYGNNSSNKVDLGERYAVISTKKKVSDLSDRILEKYSALYTTSKSGTIKFSSDSAIIETELSYEDVISQ